MVLDLYSGAIAVTLYIIPDTGHWMMEEISFKCKTGIIGIAPCFVFRLNTFYLLRLTVLCMGKSWSATEVDGNELGPVYPFQLKQLKYEDP